MAPEPLNFASRSCSDQSKTIRSRCLGSVAPTAAGSSAVLTGVGPAPGLVPVPGCVLAQPTRSRAPSAHGGERRLIVEAEEEVEESAVEPFITAEGNGGQLTDPETPADVEPQHQGRHK